MKIRERLQQSGPISRTYAMQRKYIEHQQMREDEGCDFCHIPTLQPETIIKKSRHTFVIKNRFSYSIWDGCDALEHLMIIPKKHRDTLLDFTKEEKEEWMRLCAEYEQKGFSIYTRSPDNIARSVVHHHTHFIKLGSRRKKWLFYLQKPHMLLAK